MSREFMSFFALSMPLPTKKTPPDRKASPCFYFFNIFLRSSTVFSS